MKKFLAVTLSVVIFLMNLPITALAEEKNYPEAIAVSTLAQLSSIRENLSGNYYLTNNLVFSQDDFEEGGAFYNNGQGWIPIGDNATPFTGTLNGNGYSIINLFSKSTTLQYMGLFGYNSGQITIAKHLTMNRNKN